MDAPTIIEDCEATAQEAKRARARAVALEHYYTVRAPATAAAKAGLPPPEKPPRKARAKKVVPPEVLAARVEAHRVSSR